MKMESNDNKKKKGITITHGCNTSLFTPDFVHISTTLHHVVQIKNCDDVGGMKICNANKNIFLKEQWYSLII